MDEVFQFYAGATLRLKCQYRDPTNSTLPYPLVGATASVINSTLGFTPTATITDPNAADVTVTLPAPNTLTMTKRKRGSFQIKIDLNDIAVGNPGNTILIGPPIFVEAI